MNAGLRSLWEARTRRDRVILLALAALLAVGGYAWWVLAAERARDNLLVSVAALRTQATTLAQQAIEYQNLRAMPAPTASTSDLGTVVRSAAEAAGLANVLTSINATDTDHVVVVFGAVGFSDWLDLIGDLASMQVRLESCRIEAMVTPGLVTATATLVRTGSP